MSHKFLDSDIKDEGPEFSALGSSGYKGLEVFPNPGCHTVEYISDEVVGVCPITGQPDYYDCTIFLVSTPYLIESKSLKLWFTEMHRLALYGQFGHFCEALAVFIRDQVAEAVNHSDSKDPGVVTVTLTQKSRGGISIKASA